ncbi:protein MEI2-like 4 isoform X2 [Cicer arietinum]|uniref:Protein MEI2-like 5 isoform X2 n=1 Tax=Cicer arietinum TaxID=3827 RepID=A0A1S3DZD6_CICAR|nr:protein MEI2-like 5 isoform X2 [Cicer arietinum]
MPSESMDFNSFSSSSTFSSKDVCSYNESQVGWWKSDKLSKGHDSNEVNIIANRHESSLFSSSLSDLFSRKLRLSANNALYGQSVDAIASHYDEERLFDSLEELEARIIGNLLPNEDDLFSGVTDDHIVRDSTCDDIDELDLFSSVGGLDLGDDDNSSSRVKNSVILSEARNSQLGLCNTSVARENSSRTLFVRNIDSDVEDSVLKALFEQFGDIHTFNPSCTHLGFVMISYYDIRAAQNAMRALQNRLFGCRKFDICYSTPKDSSSKKGVNQGKLAVSLYDSSISNIELHRIFNVYGEIKEIHENPHSQLHKSIEFYDFRVAETALRALNRNDATMKKLKVEPSNFTDSESMIRPIHPDFEQTECSLCLHQKNPPLTPTTSLQGLHGVNKSGSMDAARIVGALSAMHAPSIETAFNHGISSSVPNTLPSLIKVKSVGNQCEFTESSSPSQLNFDTRASLPFHPHSLPGHHVKWSNSYQPPRPMWQNSPSYFDGICAATTLQRLNQYPMSPSHMISTVLPTNNTTFLSNITPHCVDFVPHNIPNFGLNFHNQRSMVFPGRNHMINTFDTHKRGRSRRNVGASNLADAKRFELDIDCIKRGEDSRTTLMIKNIPNKYTSKMLLAVIDEKLDKGTYDFVYLPIDFRNKCNVGYAFINMTSPGLIVPFYQVFNGKKWEKFNSEKVATLAYARIQGKEALIAHFQNSSLMNEDKRCRPILIDTDGPNAGIQVPFPIANKHGRMRSNIHDDNPPNFGKFKPSSD